jgi:hypothetical protein
MHRSLRVSRIVAAVAAGGRLADVELPVRS